MYAAAGSAAAAPFVVDPNNNNVISRGARDSDGNLVTALQHILHPCVTESQRFQLLAPLSEYQRKSYRTENRCVSVSNTCEQVTLEVVQPTFVNSRTIFIIMLQMLET
jgi:hypothetical protein